MVGVVGSRQPTQYSSDVLSKLLPGIIKAGIVTVSGLASGVDCEAHKQTILNGGKTIAVIGTGLGKTYPRANEEIQRYIGEHHLVLSEYPANVGPTKYHFPERNRIIAGLTLGTLVIEAKQHSGSLITANLALQNNREVFAVPGLITSELSTGTNELILAGAKLVRKSEHIIEEFFC